MDGIVVVVLYAFVDSSIVDCFIVVDMVSLPTIDATTVAGVTENVNRSS